MRDKGSCEYAKDGALTGLTACVEMHPGELGVNEAYRARAIRTRGGRWTAQFYSTKRFKRGKARISEVIEHVRDGHSFKGPVVVSISCQWARSRVTGPCAGLAMGDVDGPVKGILDALEESGLIEDDGQVVEIKVRKVPRSLGRIYIGVCQA